ncbi:MAG: RimK/LysX family protein [Candidatus Saccharimonadales bacterium]
MTIKNDPYASYKLLGAAFKKIGYTIDEEVRNNRRYVTYTSPSGKRWSTRAALLSYPCVSTEASYVSRNKEVAYKLAQKNNISIPQTWYIKATDTLTDEQIATMLAQHDHLIVKPSNASLSNGLTLGITTGRQLRTAITKARKTSPAVVVQEQVEGEEVRFVVMNGRVVSALLRRTARVVGDGVSTIAQLIVAENIARQQLKFDYIAYPLLSDENIESAFMTSTNVPPMGEVVELNRATMIRNGCSVYDVVDDVDASYITLVEKLAGAVDTRFIVVDVFVKDYQRPKTATNHLFIEFNTSPVLKLFYGCRNGKMFDIVPRLVKSIDVTLHEPVQPVRTTLGGFEPVTLLDFGNLELIAKVDTGAYSGAIYATNVRTKEDETGRPYLSFLLNGDVSQKGTAYDFYQRTVRSAHGHLQERFVIRTYIQIQGRLYATEIGLSNRANMKYPMLIGRKFLRDNRMLVDVIVNDELDYEKELLG